MSIRKTKEQFIEDAIKVHGDKYDYTSVEYINSDTHVNILCKTCGTTFEQKPNSHLHGRGCPICGIDKRKSLVRGVGVNDIYWGRSEKGYEVWKSMLERCYGNNPKLSAYKGCEVCKEWHTLSNFIDWFNRNYIDGYAIDKDILSNGFGRIYSPDYCLFVPKRINDLFVGCLKKKTFRKTSSGKYIAQFKGGKNSGYIGVFNTEDEAFEAYKSAKEAYIKKVAQEYYENEMIDTFTYKALCNFKIFKDYGNN